MASALHVALFVPVALALVASALTYLQGWAYFAEEKRHPELTDGGASVIVPVRGVSPGIEGLLDDLLQESGVEPLEVIVAVEEAGDPAVAPVQELAETRDHLRLVVSEEEGAQGTGKIANLIAGVSRATYDRLVFVDDDVHIPKGILQDLLRPLSDSSVGLVFAAPVGANSPNLPAAFGHLFVNDSALLNGAAARRGDLPGATGALMATRRKVLDAVGGLPRFANKIVMDVPLGQAVKDVGFDLHLLRQPIGVGGQPESWTDVLWRQHRWMVAIRAFVPSFTSYVVMVLLPQTWSLVFLGVAVFRGAFVNTALGVLGLVILWKVVSHALINAGLVHDKDLWPRLWIALVAEIVWFVVFLWSLLSNRVHWAGRRFEVEADGTKNLIDAPTS